MARDAEETHNGVTNGVGEAHQPLTPYHSRLYSLLSWERPRTTGISFATVVLTIIAARYLPLARWALKLLYLSLGVAAILEITGRAVFSRGIASTSRPRKYYTIPRDTVESFLEDMEQLVDFFLIEFQRILFVENLVYTLSAFTASVISYWLVKYLPLWTLSLIAVTTAYLGPLIYVSNKEFIDEQIEGIQEIINAQTLQVKEMAESQTAHATGMVKQYIGDYRAKAHDYVVATRSRQASPEAEIKREPRAEREPAVQQYDFPQAPRDEPVAEQKTEDIPVPNMIAS